MVTASLVLYRTSREQFERIYNCIKNTKIITNFICIDNSPEPCIDINNYSDVDYYIHSKKNEGYGKSNNFIIRQANVSSKYVLILNPDIEFNEESIIKMIDYLEKNADVGQIMPKIVSPDGCNQYLGKLLPSPFQLVFRRILPSGLSFHNKYYDLRFWDYNSIQEVPILSGCFMLIRLSVFLSVGGFDESYFMYMEDYDLTRRIGVISKTVVYPYAIAIHDHAKMSYKKIRHTIMHIRSAIKYFNKWGWFFDSERKRRNRETIKRLSYSMRVSE